jgi:hypothetical protein
LQVKPVKPKIIKSDKHEVKDQQKEEKEVPKKISIEVKGK